MGKLYKVGDKVNVRGENKKYIITDTKNLGECELYTLDNMWIQFVVAFDGKFVSHL